MTDLALAELDDARRSEQPLFLWLHYFDPHSPYEPPPDHPPSRARPPRLSVSGDRNWIALRTGAVLFDQSERDYLRSAYDAEIRYVDQQLGRLVRQIDADSTLLVVTSDHGEEFWEHGRSFHGQSLYEELLRVPLLIREPGQQESRHIDRPVSLIGLGSTILERLGIDPAVEGLPGRSLLPHGDVSTSPIVASGVNLFEDQVAVVYGGQKLIRGLVGEREVAFDLAQDPAESNPLPPDDPAYGRLGEILDAILLEASRTRADLGVVNEPTLEMDPASRERLRALGYIDD